MQIRKIHYDGVTTTINGVLRPGDSTITTEHKSKEQPSPEFLTAFKNMKNIAVQCYGQEFIDFFEEIETRSVSVNETKDSVGCICTFVCKMKDNIPFTFNTRLMYASEGEIDTSLTLDESNTTRLHTLVQVAENYCKGERSQTDLFQAPTTPSMN